MSTSQPTVAMDQGPANSADSVRRQIRICVVSEGMTDSPDEGIKKFATSLVKGLGGYAKACGIAIRNDDLNQQDISSIDANKLFLTPALWRQVRSFSPDVICYVPTASDTMFSYIRLKVLSVVNPGAATMMVALQPRPYGRLSQMIKRALAPDLVLVQSSARANELEAFGIRAACIPSGVDMERFTPVDLDAKAALKTRLGLPIDEYLVLHVGHITADRNLMSLIEVQRDHQVVMVTGNSVGEDREVRRLLDNAGVIVFDHYIDAIEEVYQAADCFIFPVVSDQGSIEMPLSVLEAMACNMPVVATRFGGIEEMFERGGDLEAAGLFLADGVEDIPALIAKSQMLTTARTRELVQPYSWSGVAVRLVEEAHTIVGNIA